MCCPSCIAFAAWRTQVGARFIVHSSDEGRGGATHLPSAALRRPGRDSTTCCPRVNRSQVRGDSPGWQVAGQRHNSTGDRIISWGLKFFRVPGLGHRVSGSGTQVRILVPGLIPEPVPVPVPAAETCDPRMNPGFRSPFVFMNHLGQHMVLSLPHDHLAAVSSTPASTPRAPT